MIIGVPKEVKNNENRVAITQSGVSALVKTGHTVLVQDGAGVGSGIENEEYQKAGAVIVPSAKEAYEADLVVKVKEPVESEYALLKQGQMLFAYLHLAPNPELTDVLLEKEITGIAYETIQDEKGTLPLLTPMSEVAGRMSVQIGATCLQKQNGGRGILLGGVPGVACANVVVIGGGMVGANAAKIALGMGADVTVLDISKNRLQYLDEVFCGRIKTLICDDYNVANSVEKADLLIGAVLIAGAKAPMIVTEEMVKKMNKGAVIIDVAVDQGGCIETIDQVTTHANPTYEKHGVVHYAVANMPAAVPRTSTLALTGCTLPYIIRLANEGLEALRGDANFALGVNTYKGKIACDMVAKAMGKQHHPFV